MKTKTHSLDPNDPDCAECFIAERELELMNNSIDALNEDFTKRCKKFCAADRISGWGDIEIERYRTEFENLWKRGNEWIMELYKCELRRKKD